MDIKRSFILDSSLVLYLPLWQLDGASFMEKSAYGHLCTVTGAIWGTQGRTFDGTDDRISIPAHTALHFAEITIEIWWKPETAQANANGENIFTQWVGTGKYAIHFLRTTAEIYQCSLDQNGDGTVRPTPVTVTVFADTNWHHIVVTGNTTQTAIYVDGILEDTDVGITGVYYNSTDDFYIAYKQDSGTYGNGTMGEIRLYTRALTPIEIQYNYLASRWRYR